MIGSDEIDRIRYWSWENPHLIFPTEKSKADVVSTFYSISSNVERILSQLQQNIPAAFKQKLFQQEEVPAHNSQITIWTIISSITRMALDH